MVRNPDWRTQNQMKTLYFYKFFILALAVGWMLTNTASALVTIDSVYVSDIGNANDSTGYGGVSYGYAIGKYEVTLNQYNVFLNAVAATDTYGLYNTQLGSDPNIMGIARSGASGNYTYSVIGSGNRPVTYVSWYDSARFVNWLHNGQPTGAQNASTTEQGAYTLNGAVSGLRNDIRNANWQYGLSTENEWYKAAYYQPSAKGGDGDGYWLYPTQSNSSPNSRNGSESDVNSGNFYRDDGIPNGFNGGYAVNNLTTIPEGNVLTDAGAFNAAASYYGTFDQGGNVDEWNDSINVYLRSFRGGDWLGSEITLQASFRPASADATAEFNNVGFRVVVVPEPSVVAMAALGTYLLSWRRRSLL